MSPHPTHAGIDVRRGSDGTETFTVRWREPGGRRPRRTFDSLADALDFQAKLRSAKRWRPDELRQENGGRQTLGEYFEHWWLDHAMVDLRRSTLVGYRGLWEKHARRRLGAFALRDVDARVVVRFRRDLVAAGVGTHSVVKTLSMLQRVFRDAVEAGEVSFNPFKAVRKPSPGPSREVRAADAVAGRARRGGPRRARLQHVGGHGPRHGLYRAAPQELLSLHWYAVRERTLLVEYANADGQLDRLKNRKRSRKRSRSVDLLRPVREDLRAWRQQRGGVADDDLVFPHEMYGGLWLDEHYRTWRRRMYVPSAENAGLPTPRPYDLRHTWTSLRIAEKRLSIVEAKRDLGAAWAVLDGTDGAAHRAEQALGAALSAIDAICAIEQAHTADLDVATPVDVEEFWERHGSLPGFAMGT